MLFWENVGRHVLDVTGMQKKTWNINISSFDPKINRI